MLALIKDGAISQIVAEGAGFSHDGASWTMPATDGWELDGFSLVTIQDADPLPNGKVATGQTVAMVGGAPKFVNTLADAPPSPRQMVQKSVVQSRIIDAGKMGDAYAALTGNPIYFARWFAPDHPSVYCDDPDAVILVQALGLDPAAILAP
jgi:hypothetical protein